MSVLDEAEFRPWRQEADVALRAARIQAQAELHNWSCFMAEQAAQLAVKGLLHGAAAGPWGHDLVELGRKAKESIGDVWDESLDATLQRLSRHYIPARYPDAHAGALPSDHYGQADSTQAIEDAAQVLAAVDDAWKALQRAAEDEPGE